MKYITYKKNNIGGLGHSFCDWLSCFILSKIFNYPFIFEKLQVLSNQNRNMDVNNSNDKYFWNDYLNLENLSENIFDKSKLDLSNYEKIPIIFNSWYGTDINKIKNFIELNNNKYENIIYYFYSNTRIYIFDLFQYDIINKTSLTNNILNELKISYYSKNTKIKKEKGLINIYIRYGDLRNIKINKNIIVNNNFESNILEKINNEFGIQNYIVNIISAGVDNDLLEIKDTFSKFNNINYLFNIEQDKAFYLLTQSDHLIFSDSCFPFTASLYCDGKIYINKNTFCLTEYLIYNDIKYLNNYNIL
jgi:hypothetical protein